MQARDIMTENPVCCTPTDSVKTAAKAMMEHNCGMLPVVDNPRDLRLIGTITDRDMVCRVLAKDGKECCNATVEQAMTTGKLWTVLPTDSVDDAIERMEEGQIRRIPVVDEKNKVVGVIATADLALELEDAEDIAEVFEEISEPTHAQQG